MQGVLVTDRWQLIEGDCLDVKYAAIARDRLTAEAEGSTLQARRAGQSTLFGGT